jgi:hypothetical protein
MMKKTILLAVVLALLGASGCAAYVAGPPAAHPESAIEISLFYNDLASYGDWLWVDPWGWVWTPWDIEPGWRPYTHGHWVWTSLGWTWASDWSWGWAPFHYGRWTYHPYNGWIWIPGRVWAPAWVAWRSGHGWIGWAPLPPAARWQAGIGLDLGGVNLSLSIVQHGWSFVGERDFLDAHVWRRLEPLPRNAYRLRETEDRTRYEEVDRRVAGRGIGVEEIERHSGPVRRYRVEDVEKPPPPSPPGGAARTRPDFREGEAGRPPTRPGATPGAAAAAPQPPPSADKEPPERRATREARELTTWEQQQRQRLEQEQQQELRKPLPPGETAVERDRRQQEERRTLQKDVEREKQLLENRKDRRTKEAQEAKQAKQAKEAKEKGKAEEKQPKPRKPPGKPPALP